MRRPYHFIFAFDIDSATWGRAQGPVAREPNPRAAGRHLQTQCGGGGARGRRLCCLVALESCRKNPCWCSITPGFSFRSA